MPASPKARVSTAAPRRPPPQPSRQNSHSQAPASTAADEEQNTSEPAPMYLNDSPSPAPPLPEQASGESSCAAFQDQPERLALRVEELEMIKELFEVHDFACLERRRGRKVTATESSAAARASIQREASISRAALLDEKQRYGVSLKPLKRSPSADLQFLHETLFSTAPLDAGEPRPWKDAPPTDGPRGGRLFREQELVHDELRRLREWRQQQRMLLDEALEEAHATARATAGPASALASASSASTSAGASPGRPAPFFPESVPATAGVSLHYFANFIVGPFFASFFPPTDAPPSSDLATSMRGGTSRFSLISDTHWQPPPAPRTSLAPHVVGDLDQLPEVQQLFRMMDSNANQRVSWDEFCQYVLEAGQRQLMVRDPQQPAASQGAEGVGAAADLPASATSTGAVMALQYELGFTRQPTNESVWQSQYPLVHYLFHKDAFTKLLQSHSFPRFITAGPDGLVKLWRTEPCLHDDTDRAVIIHERNLLSLTAPITDMALSTPSMGDAEVVAVVSMDGTVTLLRVATGEMVRTLQGMRTSSATEASMLNEVAKSRRGVDHEAREWDAQDLLSLRARQPGLSATVLRQPYTVDAYHHEAVEIFFGQASRYFRGLEVMAPTYEHLKRPISLTADVLFSFGAQPSATDKWYSANAAKPNHRPPPRRSASPALRDGDDAHDDHKASRNWFATAVGLAAVASSGGSRRISAGHYLILGFENGVLQLYALSPGWFQQSSASAARVEPPSGRRPTFTAQPHSSPITHMVVSELAELLFTAASDGAIEVRSLLRLEAPLLRLGGGGDGTASTTPGHGLPLSGMEAEAAGHSKRITCMAWHDTQRILVTGGMDYRVFFWTPRSPRPLLRIDLREQQRNVTGLNSLGACGYPVDVSFMQHGKDPLRVVVLDSKRVIRFLSATSGQLMGFLVDHAPESTALGDMLVARYEAANSRLLLGGRCLRVWNTVKDGAYADDYHGHRKPVLFMAWHHELQAMVTADEAHLVMWHIGFGDNAHATARQAERRAAHAAQCTALREKAERERLLTRLEDARPSAVAARRGTSVPSDHGEGPTEMAAAVDLPVLYDEVYPSVCPTLRTDRTPHNHTYRVAQSRLLRSFHVEEGIRNIAMDPHSLTAALFVALLRENAIVQLNVFNGAPLRRFAFAPRAHDIDGLCCGDARMTASALHPSPLLCAVYEEAADMGVTALYHVHAEDEFQRGTVEDTAPPASDATTTTTTTEDEGGAVHHGGVAPYRHILSRGSLVTSVLMLSAMNLVVMGGRGQLFMTPVSDATAFAVPLRTLVDQASIEETELRRSLMLASQHRQLGLPATTAATKSTTTPPPAAAAPVSSAAAMAKANPRTSTAVLTLVALFPGRLVKDPQIEETRLTLLGRSTEEQQRRRSRLGSATSVGVSAPGRTRASSVTSETDKSGIAPEPPEESWDKLDALLEKELVRETQKQHGASGYIGQLCALGATGYVLSGNHEGVLQLWNVRTSSEVLRFRVTLTACSVTALCTNVPPHRTTLASVSEPVLVAVGDESGYVVLLDLSELPWAATQPLDMLPDLEEHVLVVDRWRAHEKDVSSVCFLPSHIATGATDGEASPPCCPRTLTLNAFVAERSLSTVRADNPPKAGNRPSAEEPPRAPFSEPRPSTGTGSTALPRSLTTPIVVVTTSEDTYTYLWTWHVGLLNCLGCFGMGALSLVTPPLAEPSYRVPRTFEVARRLYVLRRLVQDMGLFRGFGAAAAAAAVTSSHAGTSVAAGAPSTVLLGTPPRSTQTGGPSPLGTPRDRSPALGPSASVMSGRGGRAMSVASAAAATTASLWLSEEELDEALQFMEHEVHAMLNRDPAALLSTWGSLSDEKAQKAAEDAATSRTRQEVLAAAAVNAAEGFRPSAPGALSLASTPNSTGLERPPPPLWLPPPPPRAPTLFDHAGLDGAYGWVHAAAAGTTAAYEAPPPVPTLPWLCEGPSPFDQLRAPPPRAPRGDDAEGSPLFCGFSSSSASSSSLGEREHHHHHRQRRRDDDAAAVERIVPTECSAYVVAFMRGYAADEDARACLRRTVLAMRTTIGKWCKRQAHLSSFSSPANALEKRASVFEAPTTAGSSTHSSHSSPTVMARPHTAASTAPEPRVVAVDVPTSSEVGTAAIIPPTPAAGADDTRADVPSAMSPTRIFFRRSSQKTGSASSRPSPSEGPGVAAAAAAAAGAVASVPVVARQSAGREEDTPEVGQHVGRYRIRGPRGEPLYRVGYSAATPVVRSTDEADPRASGQTANATMTASGTALVRLSEGPAAVAARHRAGAAAVGPAPPLLSAHYRRVAAAAATDDIATTAVDPLDGRGVRLVGGGGAAGDVLEDEEALANADAAFVIHNAYLNHRREEALAQLLEVSPPPPPHADAAQRKKTVKAAAEIGQVGLATFDDFAATGTTTALFGHEQLLLDVPVARKPVLADHLREGLPMYAGGGGGSSGAAATDDGAGDDEDVDWYTRRDRLRRQRQKEEALWNPSRIMLTLMDWDATLTPDERAAQAKRAASPSSADLTSPRAPATTPAEGTTGTGLRLPGFLPTTMAAGAEAARPDPDALAAAATTDEATPAHTFTDTTRDMQRNMAQTRNLNAVVALEVQHLRQLMRDSLEEREAMTRAEFRAGSEAGALTGGPSSPSSRTSSPHRKQRAARNAAAGSPSEGLEDASPFTPSRVGVVPRQRSANAKVSSLNDRRKRSSTVASDMPDFEASARRKSSVKSKW